jgi:hypothetical protein
VLERGQAAGARPEPGSGNVEHASTPPIGVRIAVVGDRSGTARPLEEG